ncbi:hypothetical protein G6O46_23365 [Salmonella enterica subsp. enterica serovar Enteritidis]|uniref:hypothetical protein n=1 Tax=Salmonella enterica TaxID=28901 RepID=UPI0016540229|nr:hypothetical protein [Salmonella enterica]MBC7051954.1 hypothetical protein [Salmonella enterica subsp. enterica serovar Enteritidis]
MATLEQIEKRVEEVERRLGVIEPDMTDVPRLVSMHFDLLRAEMRAMERRLESRFDAGVRTISELIVERDKKS